MQDVQAHNFSIRLFYKALRLHTTSISPVSLRILCIAYLVVAGLYIGETGRRQRERFSEHLRSFVNRSLGFPVAEHFNSASHSLDNIMVCGLKQCNNFSFLFHIRALKQSWFSFAVARLCTCTLYFVCALTVRAYSLRNRKHVPCFYRVLV